MLQREERTLDNTTDDDCFSFQRIADIFDVSYWTVRRWIMDEGAMPYFYVRGSARVRRADVVRWMEEHAKGRRFAASPLAPNKPRKPRKKAARKPA